MVLLRTLKRTIALGTTHYVTSTALPYLVQTSIILCNKILFGAVSRSWIPVHAQSDRLSPSQKQALGLSTNGTHYQAPGLNGLLSSISLLIEATIVRRPLAQHVCSRAIWLQKCHRSSKSAFQTPTAPWSVRNDCRHTHAGQ